MTMVTVYSKLPNDIELCIYENKYYEVGGIRQASSRAIKSTKVIIRGTNYAKRQTRINYMPKFAKTEIDKSVWDGIIASRAVKDESGKIIAGDQMLVNKQIFTAKNDAEADFMIKDAGRSIFDMYTKIDLALLSQKNADLAKRGMLFDIDRGM